MKALNFYAIISLFCLLASGCGSFSKEQASPPDLTMESLKSAALQTIRAKIPPITPKPAAKATIKPIEETEGPPTMFAAPSPIITQTSQASLSPTHPNRQATITACDRAEFLGDITIPDGSILTPNFEFIKSWRVKNTGGCTWTNNYHLIYARGNPMNNKGSIPLQDTIAPGETAEISLFLKAPAQEGSYQSYWLLQSGQGHVFGSGENADEPLSVKFAVINSNASTTTTSVVPSPVVTPNEGCQSIQNSTLENALLRNINQERAKNGLILFLPQSQLARAARKHSQDMACKNFLSHTGTDGSSPLDRLATQRYTYTQAEELIYANKDIKTNIQGALQNWIKNENDKIILLSEIYTQIGIGISSNQNSEYETYISVIFAKP